MNGERLHPDINPDEALKEKNIIRKVSVIVSELSSITRDIETAMANITSMEGQNVLVEYQFNLVKKIQEGLNSMRIFDTLPTEEVEDMLFDHLVDEMKVSFRVLYRTLERLGIIFQNTDFNYEHLNKLRRVVRFAEENCSDISKFPYFDAERYQEAVHNLNGMIDDREEDMED